MVPLYYCPGKEGKACIVFVCSQLAILMVSSTSTPLQILIFINGNKMVAQFVKDSKSRVHSSLFKGSPVKTGSEHLFCFPMVDRFFTYA